jgi:hypothetical protein
VTTLRNRSRKALEREWEEYRDTVLAGNVPDEEKVEEHHHTFYAGAFVTLTDMLHGCLTEETARRVSEEIHHYFRSEAGIPEEDIQLGEKMIELLLERRSEEQRVTH